MLASFAIKLECVRVELVVDFSYENTSIDSSTRVAATT